MSATRPRHSAARRATTRSVVAVAFLVVIGGASEASAYWSNAGSGAGAGGTASSVAVTLAPGTVAASLHPGGRGDVAAEARNSGTADVVLRSLELDASQGSQGLAVDADHPSCPSTAFTFATQDNDGAGWLVPRRSAGSDGTLRVVLPGAIQLAGDAPNECQGATVTVFLRAA
jgi:hypothetical protein